MYSDSKNTKCKSTNENAGYRRRFLMLCLLLNVDSGALAKRVADPDEGVDDKTYSVDDYCDFVAVDEEYAKRSCEYVDDALRELKTPVPAAEFLGFISP